MTQMTQMFRQTRAALTAALLSLNVSFSLLAQDAPQSQPSQAPQQTQQPQQPQYFATRRAAWLPI